MQRREYVIQDKRAISSFVNRVYGWMSIGLACTAATAFFVYQSGLYLTLMPFWWVWTFAAFGIAMGINTALRRATIATVAGLFLTYAVLQGILFGTILPAYAAAYGGALIWTTFASASVIFGMAMCYGIFTRSDLTSLGRILTFGLIGLIALSLVFMLLSFFISLTWAQVLISYLGLGIFVGLTAYDAQNIKAMSTQIEANSVAGYKLSMVMALRMYINVIMIFWYLLQILSSNRR